MDDTRIAKWREQVDKNPNDELAHFSLGSALLEAGQAAEAGPHFQRVLALNSQNSRAYEMLAKVQIETGHRDLAVETLTNGYRVAHRRGDMMPKQAIEKMLTELGAAIPIMDVRPAAGAETAGGEATGFTCRRCGGSGPRMTNRPFKGDLGEKILATVCAPCWREWVGMGTKVINELRLPMYDPEAQAVYDKHMKEFLMVE